MRPDPSTRRTVRVRVGPTRLWPFLATFVVLAASLYSVHGQRPSQTITVGQPSPETFVAPFDSRIVDVVATERQRNAARSQVPTLYTVDPATQERALAAISVTVLPDDVAAHLLLRYQSAEGVREEDIPEVVTEALRTVEDARRTDLTLVLRQRLVPTAFEDVEATVAAREAAAATIEPVSRRVVRGETLVAAGDVVSEEVLVALRAVGLYDPTTRIVRQTAVVVAGCAILAALFALPVVHLVARRPPSISSRQFTFLVGMTLLAVVAQRFASDVAPELVVVAFAPIVVAVLVGESVAFATAAWLALVVAAMSPGATTAAFVTVAASSLAAARFATSLPSRASSLLAGTVGGLAGAMGLAAWQLAAGSFAPASLTIDVGLFVAGGALAGVVALAALPVAEGPFEFLTEFRLTELSSPQSPLLQRLVLQAPGTFQHSQTIANLVEQAVQGIGGNALLARVGALYHDVGKIRRPTFFTENQSGRSNPHDDVSPHLSYLIITSHVREGLDLLREHRLPPELDPFVAEHHGTTVLAYFYKRALEESDAVEELTFRYPGPKPRTKETAVLMLADAVESASRSLDDPTQGAIRSLVDRLVDQRLQDGQLDESPLTFRDLEVIASTFERVLTASLHRRIKYPSPEEIRGSKRG